MNQGIIQPPGFPALPLDWESNWEKFESSTTPLQLFSIVHHKKNWKDPRALLVLHGMGEHGGRYLHFPHYLQSDVSAVSCLDNRGHGRSEGIRGHAEDFDQFADDAEIAVLKLDEELRKKFGRSEIHLFGHSMGGLIAIRLLLKNKQLPIQSVTLSAPLLEIAVRVPPMKRVGAMFLSRIYGKIQMTSEINPGDVSHDPAVVQTYVADRLIHKKITPKFFTGLLTVLEETRNRASEITYPTQMLIPLEDRIVQAEASLEFFNHLKLKQKRLKKYPKFFHESFNEIGKEEPFEDLRSWIKMHSAN